MQKQLDSNRKPHLNVSTPSDTMHGYDWFEMWYQDVPGYNIRSNLLFTMNLEPDGNLYSYKNTSFFPIDGQGYGNQGNSHNYWFTFEIHSYFTFTGNEYFNITADDDYWLFLDNKLVLDLGGIHSAVSKTLYLNTLGLTSGKTYNFDFFFAERHTTQSNLVLFTNITFTVLSLFYC